MADEIEQPDDPPTTLLGLWRAHQVEIAITRYPFGSEELAIWTSIAGDQSSSEAQHIGPLIASVAPTGKLEMVTKTLWALDLGTEWYAVYAEDEPTAEYLAQVVEQGRELKRISFVQAPAGRGIYAGQITVMGYAIKRFPLAREDRKLY